MTAVTTEPHGDGWRWLLVDADGQRVLTGTQAYSEQAKAHQMGQLQLVAARSYPVVWPAEVANAWRMEGAP